MRGVYAMCNGVWPWKFFFATARGRCFMSRVTTSSVALLLLHA